MAEVISDIKITSIIYGNKNFKKNLDTFDLGDKGTKNLDKTLSNSKSMFYRYELLMT